MRADVRDDDGQLASGPPIEVPVEVLSVGEVRFLEYVPSSCYDGLAILLARQARRRLFVPACPHRSTVAAVSYPGHYGAARLYSSCVYGANLLTPHTHPWVYLGLTVSVRTCTLEAENCPLWALRGR